MAFQFVLGRAGTGKTASCLEQIKQRLKAEPQGKPLIWLVPEQATFQAEYALASEPELRGTLRAQVLSFRRLAWRVMQEVGGTSRLPIDDTGKKLLLHRILHKQRDRLRSLRDTAGQTGFLEHMSELFTELKRYRITADELAAFYSARISDSERAGASFANKLHDLQLVYAEFQEELSRLYLDGEDYLSLLIDQVPKSSYLREASIWIDGFYGFSPQESAVIEQLALHTEDVRITLSLDRPYGAGEPVPELELFHPTARTMSQLSQRLVELGVELNPTVVLEANPPARFAANPVLAHLERSWGLGVRPAYRMKPEERAGSALHITAAVHRRAEVEGTARAIRRLVREEGLRWRDCAVSVRNLEAYGDLIAGTFADYGIPLFLDRKRPVLHHPMVEFIRSALEVVRQHWRYDAVFRCVKTGFFIPLRRTDKGSAERVSTHGFDRLENYVLAFGIQGSRWREGADWTYRYDTSIEREEDESGVESAFLRSINHYRRIIAQPLGVFQDKLRERKTVKERVEALYELLTELQVPERLEKWSQEALNAGEPEKAREHAQVWDRVIDMLDQLVELTGEEDISVEQFAKLIETGMESIKLGLVPPTLDQVLIGSMDRTRNARIKHLFVLGVTEGVMPAKIAESGVLTETEREHLASAGLQLAEDGRRKLLDENFLIYNALCTPSEGLWISYPLADEEGKSLLPSDVIRRIRRLFPDVPEQLGLNEPGSRTEADEQLDYVTHPDKALSMLVVQLKQWMRGAPVHGVWWSVYNWFARQPEHSGRLARLTEALQYTNRIAPLSERTSRELYGDSIDTSVSRMERFVACPFSQFASHGLRLKERRMFRLEAPDVGQLFHAALSRFAEQIVAEGADWGGLSAAECERRAALVIDALTPRLQGEILLSSKRYHYIARKLKQVIGRAAYMLGEHAKRGQFQPIGLEVGFGAGERIPALHYELDNGVRMNLRGRIDRIDRADTEKGALLRVIDYKSSSKALQLGDVYYGLSLQMMTYLDVILTHAPLWLGTEAQPAGVLYFHVHNPVLQVKNALSAEQADKELRKRFKMKGLLSADADTVRLMDSALVGASGYSELLPVALKSDGGFYKSSSVATEQEWGTVRRHVQRTIREIGTSMSNGHIAIEPYRKGTAVACQGCSFQPVCQFDPQLAGNSYKQLPMLGKDLALELMERKDASEAGSGGDKRHGEKPTEVASDGEKPIKRSQAAFRPAAARSNRLAALEAGAGLEDDLDEPAGDEGPSGSLRPDEPVRGRGKDGETQ
ncbi:DNA helicase/exodeoxyribonuclease V, subunit B [Paenibacillus sp. UNCCL117]|uniref:helicase-exonuclease AddAB subunit AddB n=1 Tax=unclassified Paenibacillus TaxID=185978 RepID=UPI00088AF340|nr:MULTISPECIES: helicase-exonuclease AddAB subunit AddB [unclassified Paenibacillus]SDC71820.1 DNA helicase/exodeoxyribonuclease V, subunit B [Paenibacillus sp. cl123]SFW24588.1 DNA helicase/exodeoxyribonuclease V, subunit B [Paenibacillus sp. UNCCL117]